MPLLEGNPFVDEVIPLERTARGMSPQCGGAAARSIRSRRGFSGLDAVRAGGCRGPRRIASSAFIDRRYAERCGVAVLFDRRGHQLRRTSSIAIWNWSRLPVHPACCARSRCPMEGPRTGCRKESSCWPVHSPDGVRKQWPLELYAGHRSRASDMPLVVNGPPESRRECWQRIRGAHVHLSGIAGLIDATRRAHAVIGVDSGPMHLAAALRKPGVAIFGPTDPARNGPYGGSLRVLRSADAVTTYKRRSSDERACAPSLPAAVVEALARLWNPVHGLSGVSFPKPYADAVAKLRVPRGFVLVAAFCGSRRPRWTSLAAGLPVSIAGLALRGLGVGASWKKIYDADRKRPLRVTCAIPCIWARSPWRAGLRHRVATLGTGRSVRGGVPADLSARGGTGRTALAKTFPCIRRVRAACSEAGAATFRRR